MDIKERRRELNMSQADLGKKVGLSQQHVQRIENGYDISLDKLSLFAKVLQVNISELLPDTLKNIARSLESGIRDDYIKIDIIDTVACCGGGLEVLNENTIGQWVMPSIDYKDISHTTPDNIKMLRVKGDSMEPTLKDGDWVLVDITKLMPDSDGMFLLHLSTGLSVKRLQGTISNEILVKSDNQKYQAMTAEIGEIKILGKVIYTLNAEKVG